MQHQDISAIIEQAKQRRAEYIGRSISKHPVISLIVVAIPVLLTQVPWTPSAPVAAHQHVAASPSHCEG
ncbi:MAG: hypothetical protein ACN4G0_04600 [Polyangiales bacterium]